MKIKKPRTFKINGMGQLELYHSCLDTVEIFVPQQTVGLNPKEMRRLATKLLEFAAWAEQTGGEE